MLERHLDRCEHCCRHASQDWDSVSDHAQHIVPPARASIPERKSRGRLLPTRQATVDRPEWLSDTTLGTTASSDRTHRRYFSPFGLAMPRPSETFCSRVIAKLRVLVAIALRAFAPCLVPGPGAGFLLLHVRQTMVAATHGCPQATPDGPLHPVKRHDVPSVHPLAGRQPVMSRWPIRIRREHFAESIVDRCELSRSKD